MREKVFYLGHAYHNKTKSSQFIIDFFKQQYDVSVLFLEPDLCDKESHLIDIPEKEVDILVLFQLMPTIRWLRQYITFKKAVFFPMYDAIPPLDDRIWYTYKDFKIISFSKTLHEDLLKLGFSSLYLQYFPQPLEITTLGKKDSAFFWYRIDKVNINTVSTVLKELGIKNVHIHKAVDPHNNFVEPDGGGG